MLQRDLLFDEYRDVVRPEWIDYSGHMNVGYFLLPFENASGAFFEHLDLSRAYRERTNHALFAAETHIIFEREVGEGERLFFTTQLICWAPRWVNCIHSMYQVNGNHLAATNQLLFVHVDLSSRRAAPMPKKRQAALAQMFERHSRLPIPSQAGRSIKSNRT